MRKLVSILLLTLFSLAFVSPLLALGMDEDTSVPICCRRDGKHHCQGHLPDSDSQNAHFQAPMQHCPYGPASNVSVHNNDLHAPMLSAAIFASLVSHPTGHVQTESKRRIAEDRSRNKRGPPASILL
ncbi:MAG TPA: hypothetical protein VGC07_01985 [Granulicella sp.]